tara:strand:+ start:640 stop:783 length:144 start_codon:yes stop_codon:yes gene_type:complete
LELFEVGNWGLDLLVPSKYNLTEFRHIDKIADEINGYEFGVSIGFFD